MNEVNKDWLETLTESQIRALACQRKIEEWKTLSIEKLIIELAQIVDIQEPMRV